MEQLGLKIEKHHHEVAMAGQAEIDFRFDTLVKTADNMMIYKYVIRNVAAGTARRPPSCPSRFLATTDRACIPTRVCGRVASRLFAGKEYAGLSQLALHYIGGILKHAKALCATRSPTTNSYKIRRRGLKRRSTRPIARAIAARPCAYRPTAKAQSPNASSIVRRIHDFPQYSFYWHVPAIKYGRRIVRNYNPLLGRYPGADGMKTGFVCASGFNLVATAERDNKRFIAVVLGAPSSGERAVKAAELLQYGFNQGPLSFLKPSLGPVETLAPIDARAARPDRRNVRPAPPPPGYRGRRSRRRPR